MKDLLQSIAILLLALTFLLFFGPIVLILTIMGRLEIFSKIIDLSNVKPIGRVAIAIIGLVIWISIYLPLGILVHRSIFQEGTGPETPTIVATPPPSSGLTEQPTVQLVGTPATDITPSPSLGSSPTAQPAERLIEIENDEWCVFIVPAGTRMTIRDIVTRFLQEGDVPENYRDQVFEATGGEVWHKVWHSDMWDLTPLPEDQGPNGVIVSARVALDFVKNVEDCVGNGGRIRQRPSPLATPQLLPATTPMVSMPDGYWCVFTIPEGAEMTIRDIVQRFLRDGDSPDNYLEEVFEATGGAVWYSIWGSDAWDTVPLPQERLWDGTLTTARIGLGFVGFEECVDNGGVVLARP